MLCVASPTCILYPGPAQNATISLAIRSNSRCRADRRIFFCYGAFALNGTCRIPSPSAANILYTLTMPQWVPICNTLDTRRKMCATLPTFTGFAPRLLQDHARLAGNPYRLCRTPGAPSGAPRARPGHDLRPGAATRPNPSRRQRPARQKFRLTLSRSECKQISTPRNPPRATRCPAGGCDVPSRTGGTRHARCSLAARRPARAAADADPACT